MNNSNVTNLILYPSLSSNSRSIFVTINGDIYIGENPSIKQIVKSNSYTNNTRSIAAISSACYGLFVDINNTLYSSLESKH